MSAPTKQEAAAICIEHAGRLERAALVLREGAKQKAVWLSEAAALRAAAGWVQDCRCTPVQRIGEPLHREPEGAIVNPPGLKTELSQEALDKIAEIERHIRRF